MLDKNDMKMLREMMETTVKEIIMQNPVTREVIYCEPEGNVSAEEGATNTEANTANNAENKEVATITNNTNEQTHSEQHGYVSLQTDMGKRKPYGIFELQL